MGFPAGGGGSGGAPTGNAGGDLTGSTYPNPVVAAGKITLAKLAAAVTLDAIAGANATAGDVSLATHKLTNLTNGSSAQDAAAFGQIPTALPPSGAAGGDNGGTYPNPKVVAITETSGPTSLVAGTITDGQFLKRVGSTLVSAPAGAGTVTSVASVDSTLVVTNPTTTPSIQIATADVLFTNRPPAAAVAMNTQKLSGLAAATAAGDAVRYEQAGIVVGSGGFATFTGSTTEHAMATVAIPAGMIGANGTVVVAFSVERVAAEAANTSWKVRFGATGSGTGGTLMCTASTQSTTNLVGRLYTEFYNVNSASVQHNPAGTLITPYAYTAGVAVSGAINTANASEVNITAQLGNTADNANIYSWRVIVYPHA